MGPSPGASVGPFGGRSDGSSQLILATFPASIVRWVELVEGGQIQFVVAGRVGRRIVEIVAGRQQIRVRPDGVPTVDAALGPQRCPQGRCLAHPARAQLQAHQRGERLLSRSTRSAPAAHRPPRRGRRQVAGGSLVDHLVHQPSSRARAVSRRVSAASLLGRRPGSNMPPVIASCNAWGFEGSSSCIASSMRLVSTRIPRAYASTAASRCERSHGHG